MLDIARVDRRIVGVQTQAAILELDDQLDGAVVLAGGKIEQGVFVAAGFGEYFFERSHAVSFRKLSQSCRASSYASVKSGYGVTPDRSGEAQFGSGRIHLPDAGGGAGIAGARV